MFRKLCLLALCLVLLAAICACSLDITPSFSDVGITYTQEGKLVLTGKTSLPDGTKLSALLLQLKPERKGLYMDVPLDHPASVDVVVKDGRFASWFPSATKYGLKAGTYGLQIGVLPNQDRVLGIKNAGLAGPGVVRESDGSKSYAWETTVVTPDIPAQGAPSVSGATQPGKVFSLTPNQFTANFNAAAKGSGLVAKVVESSNTTSKVSMSKNCAGVLTLQDGKVASVLVLGTPGGAVDASADVVLCVLYGMAGLRPGMAQSHRADLVGELTKRLPQSSSVVEDGVKFSLSQGEAGVLFTMMPAS